MPQLKAFSNHVNSPHSFLNRHRPRPGIRASMVDGLRPKSEGEQLELPCEGNHRPNPFFTFLTILVRGDDRLEIKDLPDTLSSYRFQVYRDCMFDRRLMEVGIHGPLHKKYGIDVEKGAIVVVRPDGYVGAVVGLEESGWKALDAYFSGFLHVTDSSL